MHADSIHMQTLHECLNRDETLSMSTPHCMASEPAQPCREDPTLSGINQRITEWLRVVGTLKSNLFQLQAVGRADPHQLRLSRASSNMALSASKNGAPTSSLDSPC